MSQRDVALAVADNVFQQNLNLVFQNLSNSLATSHGDDEINLAVERAKNGVQLSQLALTKCREIAQILPQN